MTTKNPSHEERIAALEGDSSTIPRRWLSFQNIVSVISICVALFAVFRPEWKQESNSSLIQTIDQEIGKKLAELIKGKSQTM